MHHVIVNIGEARIVARFAESGMIRHDHAEPACPGLCEIKTIHGARAMKKAERLARACRLDNCFDTFHDQFFPYEFAHYPPPRLSRGMTSSANIVMFLTAFQCVLSA